MYWLEVSVIVGEETAEIVSEALRPFAQDQSVVLEQLGDAQNLDPNALQPDVTAKIYIPGDEDTEQLRRQISEALSRLDFPTPLPPPQFHKLEDADWANAWKDNYKPFRIGERLWIQPSWVEAQGAAPGDVVVTLDPGMAFGTGTHQTTQMCLEALEKYIKAGDRVLDVGTGSGILAVAAAKLGASEVVALDTDRQAVKAVLENAEKNEVGSRIEVFQGTLSAVSPPKDRWNLVLVNILAPVIIALLEEDDLLGYTAEEEAGSRGRLILSGIITEQIAGVERAARAAGGHITEQLLLGEWAALVVERGSD
jgi:ribosomal protein L11 methyltransferase